MPVVLERQLLGGIVKGVLGDVKDGINAFTGGKLAPAAPNPNPSPPGGGPPGGGPPGGSPAAAAPPNDNPAAATPQNNDGDGGKHKDKGKNKGQGDGGGDDEQKNGNGSGDDNNNKTTNSSTEQQQQTQQQTQTQTQEPPPPPPETTTSQTEGITQPAPVIPPAATPDAVQSLRTGTIAAPGSFSTSISSPPVSGLPTLPISSGGLDGSSPSLMMPSVSVDSAASTPSALGTPAAAPESQPQTISSASKSAPNPGAIAGGVLGALILVALLALGTVIFLRRRRNRLPPSAEFLTVYPPQTPFTRLASHSGGMSLDPPPSMRSYDTRQPSINYYP